MHYLTIIFLIVVAALVVFAAFKYIEAMGSVWDRLAAAWRGSLTVFVLAWGIVITFVMNGLGVVTQLTGDPQFATFADSIKDQLPPHVAPLVAPGVMLLGIAARLTHNAPGK